jgi:hypothetical protein
MNEIKCFRFCPRRVRRQRRPSYSQLSADNSSPWAARGALEDTDVIARPEIFDASVMRDHIARETH